MALVTVVTCSSNGGARVGLIRKLVAVLDSTEKLPVYQYDSPGCSFGMQVCELCLGRLATG